ncbi:MAG TPA: hypothetical protein VLM75_01460 [Spirochaetota bacterium]|nr:hypothetical protein [Spirochaetota bacterium]
MRSKLTNILQVVILVSGVLYITAGIAFYLSPLFLGSLLGLPLAEDWFNQIKYDAFVAPLYFVTRGFAAMVFAAGASMVLPLFDPLRYRGLVYFTGILFPLMASWVLIKNGLEYQHPLAVALGVMFSVVLVVTAAALAITRKFARSGEE